MVAEKNRVNQAFPTAAIGDSLDWKGLSSREMQDRIIPKLQNGSIILFHNGTENTASALPDILESIIAEGYSFKPAGQLIYRDNYEISHEGRQMPLGDKNGNAT